MMQANRDFYKIASMSTVGERVRDARTAAGLSQGALAKKVGIKQSTIADLESGESKGTKHLVAIAEATGVSARWLDKEKGDPRPRAHNVAVAAFEAFSPEVQKRALIVAKALEESDKK